MWAYQQIWMAVYGLAIIAVPLICRRLAWAPRLLITVGVMAIAASFIVLPMRDMQAIALCLLAAAVAFAAAGHLQQQQR